MSPVQIKAYLTWLPFNHIETTLSRFNLKTVHFEHYVLL